MLIYLVNFDKFICIFKLLVFVWECNFCYRLNKLDEFCIKKYGGIFSMRIFWYWCVVRCVSGDIVSLCSII